MVSDKAITTLALIGIGGYVIVKSGIISSIGGVGEGVSEAAKGVGGGVGYAGAGLGAGVGQVGYSIQDVMALTSMFGALGKGAAAGIEQRGEIRRDVREREHVQETEVDVAAHEQAKEPQAEIQAFTDVAVSEQHSIRTITTEKEKTQWLQRFTSWDDAAIAAAGAVGGGLLSSWKYSPIGLLQNWIMGQASVEKTAAPQQTAPTTTSGGGITASVIKDTSVRTSSPTSSPTSTGSGGVGLTPQDKLMSAAGYYGTTTPLGVIYTKPTTSTPAPAPKEDSFIKKAGSWFLKTFTFI